MSSNDIPPAIQPPPASSRLAKDPVSLLIECAFTSVIEAWVALLWGRIVFDIIGGFVGGMIPSAPPGFTSSPSNHHHSPGLPWFHSHDAALYTLSVIFFVLNLRSRLTGPGVGQAETKLHAVARRLREEGFSLLLTNAIGAMVAAWAASFVSEFSWTQMCLHWLLDSLAVPLNHLSNQITGSDTIWKWWDWWNGNQLKFSFWLFYIASICDDLGIPNLKTLARFSWRRVRGERRPPDPAPTAAAM